MSVLDNLETMTDERDAQLFDCSALSERLTAILGQLHYVEILAIASAQDGKDYATLKIFAMKEAQYSLCDFSTQDERDMTQTHSFALELNDSIDDLFTCEQIVSALFAHAVTLIGIDLGC